MRNERSERITAPGLPFVVALDDSDTPYDVVDALALAPFTSGDQPWARSVRIDRLRPGANLLPVGARVVRTVVEDSRDSRLATGEGWTVRAVRWRGGSAEVQVTAVSEELARTVLDGVVRQAAAEPGNEGTVTMGFWYLSGQRGPTRIIRRAATTAWPSIRRNYPSTSLEQLDRLMGLRPDALVGRLILLHGPAGTGKTTILRALAHEWRRWCQVDCVLDPEALFGDPGYLMEVAIGSDDAEDDDDGADEGSLALGEPASTGGPTGTAPAPATPATPALNGSASAVNGTAPAPDRTAPAPRTLTASAGTSTAPNGAGTGTGADSDGPADVDDPDGAADAMAEEAGTEDAAADAAADDADAADEDTADEDTADEDTADEDTADEDTADEDTADEDTADEDTADEDAADEDAAAGGPEAGASPAEAPERSRRRWRLLVIEDCDELLRGDARSVSGQALSRLLNLTDGLVGQGRDVLVALTTNEPLARLHPAIVRPGRCLAQVEVGPLPHEEASAWLGSSTGVGTSMTLAELFALRDGRLPTTPPERDGHTGLYL